MISVPDAGLLPITPRPVLCMNGSITSCGKPCGYVGNACAVTMPMCSQWPVVVSLPFERSRRRPATAGAPGCGGQPSSSSTFPRPSASMLGRSSPPTARATFPRVSEPSSPYSSASGSAPAPTASSTITQALGTAAILGGLWQNVLGLILFAVYMRRDHRRRRRDHVDRRAVHAEPSRSPSYLDTRERENVVEARVLEPVGVGDGLVRDLPLEDVDPAAERRVARDGVREPVLGDRLDVRAASRSSAPSST